MYIYQINRYQKVKIGSVSRILQGSVLGPMLFNIFINDMYLFDLGSDICNFADDNTIFACGNDLNEIAMYLEHGLVKFSRMVLM